MVHGINTNGKSFTDICERYEIILSNQEKLYYCVLEFTLLISFFQREERKDRYITLSFTIIIILNVFFRF